MAPFYGWGSTASRLQPLRGGSLLFTTMFPEVLSTSEGWKAESTLEPPSGFEHGTPTIIFNTISKIHSLHKSPLLISNIVPGAAQILATERPWKIKNHEKNFLFHLNKRNVLLANQILHRLCISIKPNQN